MRQIAFDRWSLSRDCRWEHGEQLPAGPVYLRDCEGKVDRYSLRAATSQYSPAATGPASRKERLDRIKRQVEVGVNLVWDRRRPRGEGRPLPRPSPPLYRAARSNCATVRESSLPWACQRNNLYVDPRSSAYKLVGIWKVVLFSGREKVNVCAHQPIPWRWACQDLECSSLSSSHRTHSKT
jgi:hypothetical protein